MCVGGFLQTTYDWPHKEFSKELCPTTVDILECRHTAKSSDHYCLSSRLMIVDCDTIMLIVFVLLFTEPDVYDNACRLFTTA